MLYSSGGKGGKSGQVTANGIDIKGVAGRLQSTGNGMSGRDVRMNVPKVGIIRAYQVSIFFRLFYHFLKMLIILAGVPVSAPDKAMGNEKFIT